MEKITCISYTISKQRSYTGRQFNYYEIYPYVLFKNNQGVYRWRKSRQFPLDEATTIKKTIKLINRIAKEREIPYILTPEQIKSHFIPTFIDILDLTEVFK